MDKQEITWCAVPVIIDDSTVDLFEMPEPDKDPEQKPVFRVTESTARLVAQDFERYRPSLVRMVATWVEKKDHIVRKGVQREHKDRARAKAARR